MKRLGAVLILATMISTLIGTAEAQNTPPLVCRVERKLDASGEYPPEQLALFKYSVEVLLDGSVTKLRRCSFAPSVGHVTCDEYAADRVTTDAAIGVRKFYYFTGQFDMQVFLNGAFIENNGRGSIAFGKCKSL